MDPLKPSLETPPAQPPPLDRASRARTAPPSKPVTTRAFVAPPGGVVEGRAYWLNGHLAIADGSLGVGVQFHALTGTVEYAKVHEQGWSEGDPIYWYPFGGCLTNEVPADESLKVGVADKDAPNPSATGFVRLDTIPSP